MLNIWFNRAYSTTALTIGLLQENPDQEPVRIFGTHKDPDSPVMGACDVIEAEADDSVIGDAYVDWALEFCWQHAIDVFIPRLHLETISAARDRFTDAGVALVAGPAEASALMEDKAAAYLDAADAGIAVPPWVVARNGAELIAGYEQLLPLGDVCMKPVTGVGASGFRVLTTEAPTLEEVLATPTPLARVHEVADVLDAHVAKGGVVPPVMLLPFLTGPEVSVDCLADEDGNLLIAIPRTKLSRRRLLVEDPDAVEVARSIVGRHKLYSVSNTQVRYWRNPLADEAPRPYLLETNARMSGGLNQTALTGVNLPWAAVRLALGRSVDVAAPALGIAYSTVSTPVILSR